MKTYDELVIDLKEILDEKRFQHTLGVATTCEKLAIRYHVDVNDAKLAGLLHDCAKIYSDEEYLLAAKEHHITPNEAEISFPMLLHAKLGAILAKEKYGVTSEDICEAIRVHTTGKPNMNMLDKILYISDYIEPYRVKLPRIEELRSMAFEDLDKTLLLLLDVTLQHLKEKNAPIDPLTEETYNFYKGI